MRAFFCLELDAETKRAIHSWRRPLLNSLAKVSWVKPENLHLTIKFLGEIDSSQISQLRQTAQETVQTIRPFSLTLDHSGAFPSLQKPRVIWVGSSVLPEELRQLADMLDAQLEKLGFDQERDFKAHVTLGRIKEGRDQHLSELMKKLENLGAFAWKVTISELTFMESQLTGRGSIYVPIFHQSFAGWNVDAF